MDTKFCEFCGNKVAIDAVMCPKCGKQIEELKIEEEKNTITCPKCQSTNVNVQIVEEQQLVTKHHGIIWWLFVGWWWIFVKWIILFIPALLAAIFIGKRKKIINIQKKVHVCQNCGNTW